MHFIVKHIKWIMLVSGLLTCTMFYAVLAPQAALDSTFGASLSGSLAEIVVRSWGVLVTLIGVMLIYGALQPVHRTFILVITTVSKVSFVGLVLSIGNQFLDKAGVTIIFDFLVSIIFIVYLVAVYQKSSLAAEQAA